MKKNILILGAGYVGNHIYNFLSKKDNYNCILVSRSELDYHDENEILKYISPSKIDAIDTVINCAGFTGRPNVDEAESRKEECWKLNVSVPLMINRLCNDFHVNYIHISSGCIYTGYDKNYNEEDKPNFGLFDYSSFYSKTKHAYELESRGLTNKIIRIRMPICDDLENPRNYLKKIMNYENLVDYVNSKTYIPEMCEFIHELMNSVSMYERGQDIYNIVNQEPLSTKECLSIFSDIDKKSHQWVDINNLKIAAPRSNCILDNTKASKIFKLSSEREILNKVLSKNI